MLFDQVFPMSDLMEGRYDPGIFKAIFMAGSPGSGKTTIANQVFYFTGATSYAFGLKMSNIDFFEGLYRRKKQTGNYDIYWKHASKQRDVWIGNRLGLLIDGTGKNVERIQGPKYILEKLGYETSMLYVDVSLDTAIKRASERSLIDSKNPFYKDMPPDAKDGERFVLGTETYMYNIEDKSWHGRKLDTSFVEYSYKLVSENKEELHTLFGDRFFHINNDHPIDENSLNVNPVVRKLRRWCDKNHIVSNTIADKWRESH